MSPFRRGALSQAWFWATISAVVASGLAVLFYDSFAYMMRQWTRPDYSHGWLVPLVSAYLLWRRRDAAARPSGESDEGAGGYWAGAALVGCGLLLALAGRLSTVYLLVYFGFILLTAGLVLAAYGWRTLRGWWCPIAYLLFMFPLPSFLHAALSQDLQLLSSNLGVQILRAFDVSVYLSGNIIDLGIYKLQVDEACSGLRYLFPMASFGFLVAYLFGGPLWQKALLFVSCFPITVVMNSARIAIIGVLVNAYGIPMAEGFLHSFEGWAVFLICIAVLFLEAWILVRLDGRRDSIASRFRLTPAVKGQA